MSSYTLVQNENGEFDIVKTEKPAPVIGTDFDKEQTEQRQTDFIAHPVFYIKLETNANLSVAQIAKQGLTRQELRITYKNAKGFLVDRLATAQDTDEYPDEYSDFLTKQKAKQEQGDLSQILAPKPATRSQIKKLHANDTMPLSADFPDFDAQTAIINSKR